jgi:VWFA-related protein
MRNACKLAAVALFSVAALAQTPRVMPGTAAPRPTTSVPPRTAPGTPTPPEDTPTFREAVQIVLVPTSVTDKKGRTINGLQPQDFQLYDNNKLQKINRDVSFLPLSLVVCIQRSANIEAILPKISRMGNVMHDMLIGQDGEAAIISFDHRVEMIQDFTTDPDRINAAVSKLKPGGQNSRLNDSIQLATRLLRNKKDRRKVILLISETMDRSSEVGVKEVALDLQLHNVDVFTLNISRLVSRLTAKPVAPRPDPFPAGARPMPPGASLDPTTTNQIHGTQGMAGDLVPIVEEIFTATKAIFVKNPAEVYTKYTGGREYSFLSQADLERSIAAIGTELRSQYILSYNPDNKVEGGFHRIVVVVNRPELKVRTRPGYWMAGVPD